MRAFLVGLLVVAACGRNDQPMPPLPHTYDDAGRVRPDEGVPDLPALELGMPALDGFAWRKRAGQPAFRLARKAEDREDWLHVVDACHQVLAADATHLEAAWLLAVALAKLGEPPAAILEALTVAVAGDFGKWGPPSLEQPALQGFLKTDLGRRWKHRVELDRPRYAEALARALVVTAAGDLYAYDPQQPRWYRLTRTYGAVIGALAVPDTHLIYYVTSRAKTLQLGVVDLARGHSSRPQELGTAGPVVVARGDDAKNPGAWVSTPGAFRRLDDEGFLHPLPAHTARPKGPWLEVLGRTSRVHRLPLDGVSADWDDRGLASAIRLASSGRAVSVPTGQIDGDTVVWSPDRARLALVAVLDEHCTPGKPAAAVYVVDAATGALHEVRRATGGLAVAWLGDGKLALAGDRGVELVDPASGPPAAQGSGGGSGDVVAGAADLLVRKRRARCTPDDEPAVLDEPADPEETDVDPSVSR